MAYALPTRCPVLTYSYAMSGTNLRARATRHAREGVRPRHGTPPRDHQPGTVNPHLYIYTHTHIERERERERERESEHLIGPGTVPQLRVNSAHSSSAHPCSAHSHPVLTHIQCSLIQCSLTSSAHSHPVLTHPVLTHPVLTPPPLAGHSAPAPPRQGPAPR
eukprot:3558861-Rhodomonas_salina.1